MTDYELEQIRGVSILAIAEDLKLTALKGNKCCCPFHDDKHPSMTLWSRTNSWKCFACGAKGTSIDLVMRHEDLSFPDACKWIAEHNNIILRSEWERITSTTKQKQTSMNNLNSDIIINTQGINSTFCRSIVETGILTAEQLAHAAATYRLGNTKDGGVIFWQIDHQGNVHDGKIMFYSDNCHRDQSRKPSWVSFRLKKDKQLPDDWRATFCLFGLHLLDNKNENKSEDLIIAVVESEKTAIICSELVPSLSNIKVLWMATGGLTALTIDILRPLRGHRVILFPDTDLYGDAYNKWLAIATEASKLFGHPITVSDLLERHASGDQKSRKIDIADFITEQ